MCLVRRHVARLAAMWLVVQCSMLALTPASLWASASGGAESVICTCQGGDSQSCPMHHPASGSHGSSHGLDRASESHSQAPASTAGSHAAGSQSAADVTHASCRGTTDDLASTVVSLLGPAAVLPVRSAFGQAVVASSLSPRVVTCWFEYFQIPDAPPPRL